MRVVPCSNACLSSQCLFKLNGLGEGEKSGYRLVKSNVWAFGPDWSIGTNSVVNHYETNNWDLESLWLCHR